MKLSDRSGTIAQSEIRSMTRACNALKGINMAQGVCDLEVPSVVIDAAKRAMDEGINIYTPTEGLSVLREAIATKMKRFYDLPIDASQVLVSDGATGAFYTACMALLNPGDEVILFEPYYGYHRSTLLSLGTVPKFVRLEAPQWTLDMDALKSVCTSKTRAMVICNPANPSGKVFTKEELEQIGAFAQEHDLIVFSDEMYEHFLYDGVKHIPALSIESLKNRCVTLSGFSKVFSITGWRLGYAIAPLEIIEAMAQFNDLIYVCAAAPLQMGAAEGLEKLGDEYYRELSSVHQMKRDLFCDALRDAGFNPSVPSGAYYVMTDIGSIAGDDDFEKVMAILKKTGVASVPGRAFYHDDAGKNMARFCYSKPLDVLQDAAMRIRKLC
ncbi:MAG TPA: aminotransferase class I/II-fold pyridoxal phosphate-dependent enzyme [Sulfuricurvum sp.]|nr:MAG: aminotransferase [Campylobacterales bacterium 16-40-21]OZA03404.1 MAG: aminotransferase [Sulfuricurvum sp. 17-40-25]HQS66592.1 aminotransferase class I/II-fold pyridoxal phosphate-dependent enzyme [Sulfuricurvum sp.]HQT35435.1 aminotransferase class I/II-fold pyridoxal phosphate-dependent enzyme [Sulfuricurvum sp.]